MMEKNAKIYLAGHDGLVGSAFLRALEREGYTHIVTRSLLELNLINQAAVNDFFVKERPEYVFLAAARVGGIHANNTYKAEFIYQNLMIAANVIHAAFSTNVKKLLNLGSSCIYPKFAPQPIRESDLLSGVLESTNEPYAIAKIAALKLCRYYNEQYGTDYLSLMPTNMYGPGDNFDLETSHVLPAMLRKFHLAKLYRGGGIDRVREDLVACGASDATSVDVEAVLARIGIDRDHVTLWGTGSVRREFLYVDDLATASLYLMNRFAAKELGEIINVGSGVDLTIRELAETVRETVGYDGEIAWDTSKPDGTPRKLLDVSRIRQCGWEPKVSLAEGIRKMYDWYLSR